MRRAPIIFFLTVFFGHRASASTPQASPTRAEVSFGAFTLKLPGELRLTALRLSPIEVLTVDPDVADKIPLEESFGARLRWKPSLTWETGSKLVPAISILTEVDLIDGMAFVGQGREVLAFSRASRIHQDLFDPDNIRLNAAFLAVRSPLFTLLAGRQKSHLGLGMVANNGNDRPDDFGIRRLGDIVDRGFLIVRPLLFFEQDKKYAVFSVAMGFDHVERDLFADRARKDRAYQAIGQVQFAPSFGQMGVTYLYRWQHNSVGDRTHFHLVDIFADLNFPIGDFSVGCAGEWAMAAGFTEAPRSIVNSNGVDVLASALVLRTALRHRFADLTIEIGRATGDSDPYDDKYTAFIMNPDYRVGLILFPEVLKATSAVAAWNASRTWFQGVPPRGIEALPTDGGVQNALYVNPKVTLKPLSWLDFALGLVVARAETPLVDPFRVSVASKTGSCGTASAPGPRCGPASRDLGYEVDSAVRGRVELGPISLLGVLEYGFFKPGKAFADAGQNLPSSIHLVQGRLHLSW